MATDFAVMLHRFLTSHLAGLRGCSPNTIASYRDAFKLLIAFFADVRSIPPGKLTLDRIDDDAITGFLNWLEAERHDSISTRNQRLAAISSFFRWMQSQDPVRMASCQEILAIPAEKARPAGREPPHRRADPPSARPARPVHPAPDGVTRPCWPPFTTPPPGFPSSPAVAVRDIRVEPPPLAVLTGKGRKTRHVPLGGNTAALLAAYLAEHGLDQPGHDDHPLFVSQHRSQLSRGGVAWILGGIPGQGRRPGTRRRRPGPHILRHSKAMHLCEAGIPLPYIRDILGHADLSTTEIYARASTEAKRQALEAAYDIVTDDLPEWNQNPELLNWLASL